MKITTIFCISDSRLTLYSCRGRQVQVIDVFELGDGSNASRLSQQLDDYKKTRNLMLFDLSCEDYHHEKLPHVFGRDRQLLIRRKLDKYFPSGEYAYSDRVSRLKTGRRDDIYSMSGIPDSSSIDSVIDLIADLDIEISGVYSLPLLVAKLVHPVDHKVQVLVVSCDEEQSGRYVFRQSFVDAGHLIFSRQTSVLTGDDEKIPEQFRKEIERTWQYLNNKRVLVSGERMQVLMVLPQALEALLQPEAGASRCDYVYVDPADLNLHHDCDSSQIDQSFAALGAFLLSKNAVKKDHYKPHKIAYFHRHQQFNRWISRLTVFVVLLAVVLVVENLQELQDIKRAGAMLASQSNQAGIELDSYREKFDYRGPSPEKLKALVSLHGSISHPEALPDYVFSAISRSFTHFGGLTISQVEWSIDSLEDAASGVARQGNDDMNSEYGSSGVPSVSSEKVVVLVEGTVQDFDGNYRRVIARIDSLAMHLATHSDIASAIVTKLPLDIAPGVKTSRSLSTDLIPMYALKIILNKRAL